MKTKEGGVMDIQKDKDFTSLPEIAKLYQACKERDLTIAEREYLKGARDAWQAAKAQAVPEGFVLMPKEPTDEIIEAMNEFDYRNDYSDMDGAYRTIVETLEKAQAVPDVVNNRKWISCADVRACRKKAMTEAAQEQAND